MNSFDFTLRTLCEKKGKPVRYYSLAALAEAGFGDLFRLPYCIRPLLESLLRNLGHAAFSESHVCSFAAWKPGAEAVEFPFLPARVLLQDFTGVPCVVDLAAMREAIVKAGGRAADIEPCIPVDLIIDHSVQVDAYGCNSAYQTNLDFELRRNRERYEFLRWGQAAFKSLGVLPPGLGICHQVDMELLGTCVTLAESADGYVAYPDTLVGTDSHTPMINSMGIVGWGVGGIEAEAAMLGQPIPILTPVVTGMKLVGRTRPGVTPTDIALTCVAMLREKGVVGQFVEYFGPGLDGLTLADRAPLANMTPEYGATMGFFPVDGATLDYLRMTGRAEEHVAMVETYTKEQGLFRDGDGSEILYNDTLELDLDTVEPSLAGPKRPQERISLAGLKSSFLDDLGKPTKARGFARPQAQLAAAVDIPGKGVLRHGSVVIAAITSCTNTSNPSLLLGAGILARKAVEKGLRVPTWVKTSFAPGSMVAADYLERAGLADSLNTLGFQIVAYGCTTCIGNSGPLPEDVAQAIEAEDLIAVAVLSGNRNFEGRISPHTQANYLCSPALVVAFALKGTAAADLTSEPLGQAADGTPVYLRDIWPTEEEIKPYLALANDPELYRKYYSPDGLSSDIWEALPVAGGSTYEWAATSTYIRHPPWLDGADAPPPPATDIAHASVLALLGDFVTTDHISPAGAIAADGPAADYLRQHGVEAEDFNSFGSRRGNHEVMVRGTFANPRLRNQLVERAGGYTVHHPTGEIVTIFEAATRYAEEQTPLVVLAGKMYGAGSSRDWAAKGPKLLGVRAVIAQSYERIHRSNLVGMGILPLQFLAGQSAESLGLTGRETISVRNLGEARPGGTLKVSATKPDKTGAADFDVLCRIDSPVEVDYFRHGGVLPYVLRKTAGIA